MNLARVYNSLGFIVCHLDKCRTDAMNRGRVYTPWDSSCAL